MEWRIDPANPAEVFACAGLAHLAWREDPGARTGFVAGDDDDGAVSFVSSRPEALSGPFALDPAELESGGVRLGEVEVDWWLRWGLNPGLKTWSGQQSGCTVHRSLCSAAGGSSPGDEWLTLEGRATDRQKGRLGVDTRSNWTRLGLGWSPNEHSSIHVRGRPFVELLASVGLQAFPVRRSGGGYRYHLWRPAALPVAVAAFGARRGSVHSLGGYHVTTTRNGPNTVLRRATPLAGPGPRLQARRGDSS